MIEFGAGVWRLTWNNSQKSGYDCSEHTQMGLQATLTQLPEARKAAHSFGYLLFEIRLYILLELLKRGEPEVYEDP